MEFGGKTLSDMNETIPIECRFFATYREAVGTKTIQIEVESGTTVGELLARLETDYPKLAGELLAEGEIQAGINVLKNGRSVVHMDGPATPLDATDTVSVFPPVAGGTNQTEIERTVRGIPRWLAIQYLEELGGTPHNESTIVGDGWQAEVSEQTVEVGPTMTLTELTVRFVGADNRLSDLVPAFDRKAMRAGG